MNCPSIREGRKSVESSFALRAPGEKFGFSFKKVSLSPGRSHVTLRRARAAILEESLEFVTHGGERRRARERERASRHERARERGREREREGGEKELDAFGRRGARMRASKCA
ncbi:hypothetical protein SRHO_G00237540 [Serrasalmus rhombeus]